MNGKGKGIPKSLMFIKEVDDFCKKLGNKWSSFQLSLEEGGCVSVKARVNENRVDCITVGLTGSVHSQREVGNELQGSPREVKWSDVTQPLVSLVNTFKELDMSVAFYDTAVQAYAILYKDGRVQVSSLNIYNAKKTELISKANEVLVAISNLHSGINTVGLQKLTILDMSKFGQICLIDFNYSLNNGRKQYRYKGQGVVEIRQYINDELIKSHNMDSEGVLRVRQSIMTIVDNFDDLSKVVVDFTNNTLQLHREIGVVYVCDFTTQVGELRVVSEDFIKARNGELR